MTDRDAIKQATSLLDLARSYNLTLERKGRLYWSPCPFHAETKASFKIDPAQNSFYCFGCKQGGDVFTFVMLMDACDFHDALKSLAERAGITLKNAPAPPRDDKALAMKAVQLAWNYFKLKASLKQEPLMYLKKRAFSLGKGYFGYCPPKNDDFFSKLPKELYNPAKNIGLIRENKSGAYLPLAGRLIFSINNMRGQPIAFAGRALDDDDDTVKYINSPQSIIYNKSDTLYMLDRARRAISSSSSAIVVEGYFDALRLHDLGYANTVATCGTSFTERHATMMKNLCDEVIIWYDFDNAGKKAAAKAALELIKAGCRPRIIHERTQ